MSMLRTIDLSAFISTQLRGLSFCKIRTKVIQTNLADLKEVCGDREEFLQIREDIRRIRMRLNTISKKLEEHKELMQVVDDLVRFNFDV